MTKTYRRQVIASVLATDTHCDNDYQHMSADAKYCSLFEANLVWDKRRKYNGNKRLPLCVLSERQVAVR